MCGKAWRITRSVPQCPPIASSSETKPFCHLANVQRMHVVSVCLHYGNMLWQRPLPNRKIRSRFIICTQSALILCTNWTSICRDIRQNTPVIWPDRTRRSQISSVNSGVNGPNFTKLSHGIGLKAILALLMRTTTLCLKENDNDVAHYNFNPHKPILIIFGTDVAE